MIFFTTFASSNFSAVMSFKTSYKTVDYQTNLPYNCIYYVPGKDDELLDEVVLGLVPPEKGFSRMSFRFSLIELEDIQGFEFHFCLVRPENLSDSALEKLDVASREQMLEFRKHFPVSEHSYFLVHLLPEWDDISESPDTESDTLLVGVPDNNDPSNPLAFAKIAAQTNFKQMMGMTEEEYERREEAEKQMGVFERMMSQHGSVGGMMEFQTTHKRSRVHAEVVSRNREQVKNYYLDKFSEMINGPEPSFEQLMELIAAGYDDGNNTDKLQEPCPICAGYFEETDSYEVFLCPPNDEPIVCEFERGVQTKTLFIFFLRHADGIRLKDLESEESMDELARIYHKLKICDMQEANRKAVALAMTQTRSQAISDIRNLFNGLFVKSVASQYCIAPMDGKRNDGLYGITLDEEFIDLCKPFDKAVIEE